MWKKIIKYDILPVSMRVFQLLLLLAAMPVYAQNLPNWYIPLRDAVYEQQRSAEEIASLYRGVSDTAQAVLSGADLYVMLSRCEYMMGRAYQYEEQNAVAAEHYTEGMSWAEKAIAIQPSSEAWQMFAENISQSCAIRGVSYAMANGLKVEKYSKNALALNSRNAAAMFMIAARWVYAPSPFHNYKKGIEMMEAIIDAGDMDTDDAFNVHVAIGYAYIQQKKHAQARPWLLKSLEIYPSNQYVQQLLTN